MKTKRLIWIGWFLGGGILISYYANALVGSGDKTGYLPGKTSSGHWQIEKKCEICHTDPFGGTEVLQNACNKCHKEELKQVDDSHPKSKFTDPRNADRVKQLDARYCVTCHREHKPQITHNMGVTLPEDFCFFCHQDIAKDRPSHKGMAFDTCADAGCHNFHDNKALYEDFLVKHAAEPDMLAQSTYIKRDYLDFVATIEGNRREPLSAHAQDAVAPFANEKITSSWSLSAHANGGVNCSGCHNPTDKKINPTQVWIEKPNSIVCRSCHKLEAIGFFEGKHGMKLAAGLGAMQASLARIPIKQKNRDKHLECNTCHDAHDYQLEIARTDACLQCHDDEHSRAFKNSSHYLKTKDSPQVITCATCHLPRLRIKEYGTERTLVQHNQNATLRPNEKMIRAVCMNCHGLAFAIDALADVALIENNFASKPEQHIKSIEMAVAREKTAPKKKKKRTYSVD